MPRFVGLALDGEPITIHGDGSQFRAYVAVEDLAEAHTLALGLDGENQVFNLEGEEPVSIRQLAEGVARLVGGHASVEHLPGRPGDFAGTVVSAEKARRVLGWARHDAVRPGLAPLRRLVPAPTTGMMPARLRWPISPA